MTRHIEGLLGAALGNSEGPLKVGDRVALTQDVDRYPHGWVHAGATGTVVYANYTPAADEISVHIDVPVPGLEEWANCVEWYDAGDAALDLEVIPVR